MLRVFDELDHRFTAARGDESFKLTDAGFAGVALDELFDAFFGEFNVAFLKAIHLHLLLH